MRKLICLAIAGTAVLALTACGGGDNEPDDDASPAAGSDTVEVTAAGGAFEPATAEAAAGTVSFYITNEDDAAHTFTIDEADIDIALDPQSSGSGEAELEAGEYEWYCRIHGGMKGTLTVS